MHKTREWTDVRNEMGAVVVQTSPITGEIVIPLFMDDDGREEAVCVAYVERVRIMPHGTAIQVPWLRLMMPAMCGHYGCGCGFVEVCLN